MASLVAKLKAMAEDIGVDDENIIRVYNPELSVLDIPDDAPVIAVLFDKSEPFDRTEQTDGTIFRKTTVRIVVLQHLADQEIETIDEAVDRFEDIQNGLIQLDNWVDADGSQYWIDENGVETEGVISQKGLEDNLALSEIKLSVCSFSVPLPETPGESEETINQQE